MTSSQSNQNTVSFDIPGGTRVTLTRDPQTLVWDGPGLPRPTRHLRDAKRTLGVRGPRNRDGRPVIENLNAL